MLHLHLAVVHQDQLLSCGAVADAEMVPLFYICRLLKLWPMPISIPCFSGLNNLVCEGLNPKPVEVLNRVLDVELKQPQLVLLHIDPSLPPTTVQQIKKGRVLTHQQEIFKVHPKAQSHLFEPSGISNLVPFEREPIVRVLVRNKTSEIVLGDKNLHGAEPRNLKPYQKYDTLAPPLFQHFYQLEKNVLTEDCCCSVHNFLDT